MTIVEMLARKLIVLVFVGLFQTLWIDRTEKSLLVLSPRGSTRKAIKRDIRHYYLKGFEVVHVFRMA
jgi:hypothetical protein